MKKYTAYEGSEYVAKIPDENGVVHLLVFFLSLAKVLGIPSLPS
jgi:hypothetical protein